MKQINQFIDEKLNLNKDSKIRHIYRPENISELRQILEKLISERGHDADLNDIDTSKLTSMYYVHPDGAKGLFKGLDPHNIKINKWDVSKVIDMGMMFSKCENFNVDLSEWNVENVERMSTMFYKCASFTGKGLNKWKTLSLKKTNYMFARCENFTGKTIERMDVSGVKEMRYMFKECKNLNCNLSRWKTGECEDMEAMFKGCENFKGTGLNKWNIKNADFLDEMFSGCTKFNCDLNSWDLSVKHPTITGMFEGCTSLKKRPKWCDNYS